MKVTSLASPWVNSFCGLIRSAQSRLVLCSPYIARGPCDRIISILATERRPGLAVHVMTDLSRDNMLSGVTDVSSLVNLCESIPNLDIRFFPNLHAKVYIADESRAIVSSGNLTENGLNHNFEYGVSVEDTGLVKRISTDILEYRAVGSVIELPRLKTFKKALDELGETRRQLERKTRTRLRQAFDAKVQGLDSAILQARVDGLTPHAVFADTVLFLLRKNPYKTKNLYDEIKAIHPDLCDESIKLVISGETWNQARWRHKVRHAQLFLSRQGRIALRNGVWHFVK